MKEERMQKKNTDCQMGKHPNYGPHEGLAVRDAIIPVVLSIH
jgi:hypothetical protein